MCLSRRQGGGLRFDQQAFLFPKALRVKRVNKVEEVAKEKKVKRVGNVKKFPAPVRWDSADLLAFLDFLDSLDFLALLDFLGSQRNLP